MNVTLRNDFHATECVIRCDVLPDHDGAYTVRPNRRQITRAKRVLCVDGCTCSDDCGCRGPQSHGDKRMIVDTSAIFSS